MNIPSIEKLTTSLMMAGWIVPNDTSRGEEALSEFRDAAYVAGIDYQRLRVASALGLGKLAPATGGLEIHKYSQVCDEAPEPARDRFVEQQIGPSIRLLADHEADPATGGLEIQVHDHPGAGGACHAYVIYGFNSENNASARVAGVEDETCIRILFQNGPIGEVGLNGVTNEALLAILIDRMRGFQSGRFACKENGTVLTLLEVAMQTLHKRTLERKARGVEGTNRQ